ncbi:MAG: hypothetical protein IPL97_12715 [Niastella sp.]|nr:hypothetical protein [Niastella sp.]
MNEKINIQTELESLSPVLMKIGNKNIFSVPAGYFDEVPAQVLHQLHSIPDVLMPKIQTMPGDVPAGYFEGLAGKILERVKNEEEETSAILKNIGNTNVFTVPDGYFNNLSTEILAKIPRQAKVISLHPFKNILRYATAAVITGLLGLSIFLMLQKNTNSTPGMDKVVLAQANKIIANKSFDEVLNSLSESDIEKYLTAQGQDVDAALVFSAAADDNALPGPEEYLLNDKTLDNVLQQFNLTN